MPVLSAQAATTLKQSASATLSSLCSLSSTITSTAVSLPQTYSTYVAANASSISQVESGLRSLTYLLPGARLHDSELASESLHSFIQLLSIYHDHLLKARASLLSSSPTLSKSIPSSKPRPTPHMRYTDFWASTSPLYTRIATVLKIVQYTELLWEIVARRRGGERTRWRVVVFLESFKALCKLILMRLTGSRPLVNPPLPTREEFAPVEEPEQEAESLLSDDDLARLDPEPMNETEDNHNPPPTHPSTGDLPTPPLSESDKAPPPRPQTTKSQSSSTAYPMPRTGHYLPALPLPTTSSISSYLLSHVITPDDVKPAYALLARLSTLSAQGAEILYILRPVIYALLLQRTAARYGFVGRKWRRDWTPWLVGVGIEYAARAMAKRARMNDPTASPYGGGRFGMSGLEREEAKRRGMAMGWWGMRGAFYETVTKGIVEGVRRKVKKVPLVGELVAGVVEDYEWLWGEYYFSTA
jgi:peroxin-16